MPCDFEHIFTVGRVKFWIFSNVFLIIGFQTLDAVCDFTFQKLNRIYQIALKRRKEWVSEERWWWEEVRKWKEEQSKFFTHSQGVGSAICTRAHRVSLGCHFGDFRNINFVYWALRPLETVKICFFSNIQFLHLFNVCVLIFSYGIFTKYYL